MPIKLIENAFNSNNNNLHSVKILLFVGYQFSWISRLNKTMKLNTHDYILDIAVVGLQKGTGGMLMLGFGSTMFVLRPKIKLIARLRSKEKSYSFSVTQKADWSESVLKTLSLKRVILGSNGLFSNSEMTSLLEQASYQLLLKIKSNVQGL